MKKEVRSECMALPSPDDEKIHTPKADLDIRRPELIRNEIANLRRCCPNAFRITIENNLLNLFVVFS
jgi:hypothetical protein